MIYAATFISIFIFSLSICSLIVNSNKFGKLIKRVLYVPCIKSSSGALLLGGLSIFAGSAIVMLSGQDSNLDKLAWFAPAIILAAIGYLDDRIELKASIKLSLQVTAALTFCAIISYSHNYDTSLFLILSIWSLGVFNGSNLLDGIDTYSVKYSIITYSAFAVAGYFLGLQEVVLKATFFMAPIIAFYFYNKFPSRLHLGEVGSTIMGLNCMYMSVCLYNCMVKDVAATGINVNSLLIALSLMHLPMSELGISLLRRLAKGKSPFKGDKKHIHYLLANIEKKGPSKAASILSVCHSLALVSNLVLFKVFNPAVAFLGSGMVYVSYYLYFGLKHWTTSDESIENTSHGLAELINLSDYREDEYEQEQKKSA